MARPAGLQESQGYRERKGVTLTGGTPYYQAARRSKTTQEPPGRLTSHDPDRETATNAGKEARRTLLGSAACRLFGINSFGTHGRIRQYASFSREA